MAKRRRDLTPEERELWQRVARSARPLFPDARSEATSHDDVPGEVAAREAAPKAQKPVSAATPKPTLQTKRSPGQAPPPGPIDRRIEQRLRRGAMTIDARLDLHGMTQKRAHASLHNFLASAQAKGWRTILVITGKGAPPGEKGGSSMYGEERGVLNRQVPHWLSDPELRPYVSGFREAHARHGGRGALYVRIRRPRHHR